MPDDQLDHDGLLSRVQVIEGQALEHRAAAFGLVLDELAARLEAADPGRTA